jgi:hypothetical protein
MSHNIFMAKQDPRLTFSKFAPKIVLFLHNVLKYGTGRQATDDNTMQRRKDLHSG